MSVITTPDEVRLAHERFGVFQYADELSARGVGSAAEQIAVILWFVRNDLTQISQAPSLDNDEGASQWIKTRLSNALMRLHGLGGVEEALRAAASKRGDVEFWNLDRGFAELLNYRCGSAAYPIARAKLKSRGFSLRWNDVYDLATQFVLVSLPRAVRSFDPLRGNGHENAWLASVFYRFALRAVLSDRVNQIHLEALENLPSETLSPVALLELKEQERVHAALPHALEALPLEERRAIALYFGLDGREHTLSQIGRELCVSEYLARTTVVRALARLCALLGAGGRLERDEIDYLRLTFVDGMDLRSAALHIGISLTQARILGARIGDKLRDTLRSRTVASRGGLRRPERETTTMSTAQLITFSKERISESLKKLTETPPLRRSAEGVLEAQLDDSWIRVDEVRKIVSDDVLAQALDDANVPVGWLFVPDAQQTSTLTESHSQWLEDLESMANRSWISAELIWEHCLEYSSAASALFSVTEEDGEALEDDRPAARIHRILASVSHSLESRLPNVRSQDAPPTVRIVKQDDGALIATWINDPSHLEFNLVQVLQSRASLIGELPDKATRILSAVFAREFPRSEITLPGFRREEAMGGVVLLKLLSRLQSEQQPADSVDMRELVGFLEPVPQPVAR